MKKFILLNIFIFTGLILFSQNAEPLTDPRDAQVYKTVMIGNQVWMAQNLNYDMAKSWCYNDDFKNCNVYGRLYSKEAATKACPKGWRLPDDNDWEILVKYFGTKHELGAYLKDASTTYWKAPNTEATNKSGFTALPGGHRLANGNYAELNTMASFWSQFNDKSDLWGRHLVYNAANLNSYNSPEIEACSLRCIKD